MVKAIKSILKQTFTSFEFIIINDGSTDNSLNIINSFEDSRIKVINNIKNKGLVFSLNKGIKLAKGKYIARMDADDISMPHRFKQQFNFLEKNSDYAMVGSSAIIINELEQPINTWNVNIDTNYLNMDLLFGSPFIHPTILARKSIFLEFNYDANFYPAEDLHLWFIILQKYKIANIAKPLLYYRIHDNKISILSRKAQAQKAQVIYRFILHKLKIQFTDKDFLIHSKIAYHANTQTILITDLKEIEKWLLKLSHHEIFQNNNYLSKKWFQVCCNNNNGISTFKLFHSSVLSFSLNHNQKIYLLLISIIISLFGHRFFHTLKRIIKWIIIYINQVFLS